MASEGVKPVVAKRTQRWLGRGALPLAAIVVAAGPGCARAPELVLTHDLVAEFPVAAIACERSVIDFGTDEARPLLTEGWSWDETRRDGTTFVWATGDASQLELFLAEPRQLRATLRCFPFRFAGAPTQWLEISVNDTPIDRLQLEPGVRDYPLTVPADALVAGRNRVTLGYAYHRRPSEVRNSGDERSLAVGWELIQFDDAVDPGGPRVDASTGELFVPFGTEIAFHLDLEDGSRLHMGSVETDSGTDGRLEVWWVVDGHDARRAAVLKAADMSVDVGLPRGFPGPTRVALRAIGGVRGGNAGFRVDMPTLHGPAATEAVSARREPAASVATARPSTPPHVLIYLVDTLRADRLGCYGHVVPVSPNIDRLASEGALFEHVVAQSSWTKPAVVSVLSGLGPLAHGVNGRRDRVPESITTLAELLREHGYRTAAFAANAYITDSAGFAQGFDDFDFGHARSHAVTDKVVTWLNALPKEEPLFLYVHTIDPHAPYEPTQPYRDRFASTVTDRAIGTFDQLRAIGRKEVEATDELVADMVRLYDAEVAENDHAFGVLLDHLRALDLLDDMLIVLLSDHGEEFREHGVFGHGWDLYREVVDVPMIIRPPGGRAARRIDATVQHIDVVPTVLEAIGAETPRWVEGVSLWSAVTGEGHAPDGTREATTYMDYEGRQGIAISHRGWKLIEPLSEGFTPGPELYRRQDDPNEHRNVAGDHEVRQEFLRSLVRRHLMNRTPVEAEDMPSFDHDTRRALEALGYLE